MTAISTNGSAIRPALRHNWLHRIPKMVALHRQRRQLAQLDDRALRDIGLTREEARSEAARPVWDAPAHWFG